MIIESITGDLLDIAWPRENGTHDLSDAILHGAILRGADLRDAILHGADLRNADLSRANLHEADLRNADLNWANLHEADLRNAILHEADLHNADLSRAILRGADLRGANLRGANLRGAKLSGADLRGATVIDAGQDSRGYRFVARQGDPMVIAAGCRWLMAAEAREHWANNPECLGKVEMIIAEATRRGWTV